MYDLQVCVQPVLQLYDPFLVDFEVLIWFIDGFFCKLHVSPQLQSF